MKMNLGKILATCLLAGLSSASYAMNDLTAYIAKCEQDLGIQQEGLKGFDCFDGEFVPGGNSLGIGTQYANNYLGRVEYNNADVDAVFLCRGVQGTGNSATYVFAGYILQNRANGNTCFFDGKIGSELVDNVKTPPADNGDWQGLPYDEGPGGNCVTCHVADPFIITPGISEQASFLGLIGNHRNTKGPYNVVSNSVQDSGFTGWNTTKFLLEDQTNDCANACHRLSLGGSADRNRINSLASAFMQPVNLFTSQGWRNWYFQGHAFDNTSTYFRLQSASNTSQSIHIQNTQNQPGSVNVGSIQQSWWSAQWSLELVQTFQSSYYRIKNRWSPNGVDEYLSMDSSGSVTTTSSPSTSAEWQLVKASSGLNTTNAYHIVNRSNGKYLSNLGFLYGWDDNDFSMGHWYINGVN